MRDKKRSQVKKFLTVLGMFFLWLIGTFTSEVGRETFKLNTPNQVLAQADCDETISPGSTMTGHYCRLGQHFV